MLSSAVEIKEYIAVKDEGTSLYGINRIRKDGTQSEVVPKVFLDVAFACSYGKKFFAVKAFDSIDKYVVFNYTRTAELDGVYDVRFLEKAIWVKMLSPIGKFRWHLVDEKLATKTSVPDFVFPIFGEKWYICKRVGSNAFETVSTKDDPDTKYKLNLETGEYSEILKSVHRDRETKELDAYDIRVKSSRIYYKDNKGEDKTIASVASFNDIEPIVNILLNSQPAGNDEEGKVYKGVPKDIAIKFINVMSTIKTGDAGHHITYLTLYVSKIYKMTAGTLEFLIQLEKELNTGFTKVKSYETSGDTWELSIKLYKIEEEVIVLSRLANDRYKSRINLDVTDKFAGISQNEYEWLRINDLELLKKLELLDSSVKSDIPVPECIANQKTLVKSLLGYRYLDGDKVEVSINSSKVKLDVYYNFVYEPKDNKRKKNKVYEVTTYNNAVNIVSVGE